MIKEIEEIIKHKAYIELTSDERAAVSEWVEGEDAFNEMKWFLTETEQGLNSEKIEASSALKKGVMAHLTESKKRKGFWLNSAPLVVVGNSKKIYQKPLFQLAVAACLVVGFLIVFNSNLKEDTLVMNDPKEYELENQIVEDEMFLSDDNGLSKDLDELQDMVEEEKEEIEVVQPSIVVNENNEFLSLDSEIEAVEEPEIVEEMQGYSFSVQDADAVYYMDDEVLKEEPVLKEKAELEELSDEVVLEEDVYRVSDKVEKSGNSRRDRKKRFSSVLADVSSSPPPSAELNTDALKEGKEQIIPKSMHIKETPELDNLFFIVK